MLAALAMSLALPALAQAATPAPTPVKAPAPAWDVGPLPEAPGSCRARLAGPQVDLIMMINNDGKVVLMAGSPAWKHDKADFDSLLAVNGGAPVHLSGTSLGPLFLTLLTDDLDTKVHAAKTLDWTLPDGQFHIVTPGMGPAIDTLRTCTKTEAAKAKP
jgi:hypothetical protein